MNPSFLYHAFGIRNSVYLSTEYKDSSIYLNKQARADKLNYHCCKSKNVILSGSVIRVFKALPIGRK